jgi:hypothetical protein
VVGAEVEEVVEVVLLAPVFLEVVEVAVAQVIQYHILEDLEYWVKVIPGVEVGEPDLMAVVEVAVAQVPQVPMLLPQFLELVVLDPLALLQDRQLSMPEVVAVVL